MKRLNHWLATLTPATRLRAARHSAKSGDLVEADRLYGPLLDVDAIDVGVSDSGYAAVLSEAADAALANGRPVEAEGIFRRALSQSPDVRETARVHLGLAKAMAAQGRWPDAASHIADARDAQTRAFGPRSEEVAKLLADVAKLQFSAGEMMGVLRTARRARIIFERLEEDYVKAIGGLLRLSRNALLELEWFDAAVAAASRVLECVPLGTIAAARAAAAWCVLGNAQTKAGRYDDAAESYRKADACVGWARDPTPTLRASVHSAKGVLCCFRRDFAVALQPFEAALALRSSAEGDANEAAPTDRALAMNNLGYVLAKLGRPKEAGPLLDEAYALARGGKNEPYILHSGSAAAAASQEWAEAERLLNAAYVLRQSLDPRRLPLARDQEALGDVYATQGRWAAAAAAYTRAAALAAEVIGPAHPERTRMEDAALVAAHLAEYDRLTPRTASQ